MLNLKPINKISTSYKKVSTIKNKLIIKFKIEVGSWQLISEKTISFLN
jgi:hypothetical protein